MSKEHIKYYRDVLDDGCIQSWVVTETGEPIEPEKDINLDEHFSIYKDSKGKEMAVSPRIKSIILAIMYEQLLELGLVKDK